MIHTGNKIIDEVGGKFFVRGQRQFSEDAVEKTKENILSEDGINVDDILNKAANAETYTKNKTLSNFEGDPEAFAAWKAEEEAKKQQIEEGAKAPKSK